jgi:hypothetical protein
MRLLLKAKQVAESHGIVLTLVCPCCGQPIPV